MDNLSAHRPKRIKELIEQRGCELLYLPSYSPDYKPIEEAFAKIKNLLRRAASRSKETLLDTIGAALSGITAEDAQGFFEHAGYHPTYGSPTVKRAVRPRGGVNGYILLSHLAVASE